MFSLVSTQQVCTNEPIAIHRQRRRIYSKLWNTASISLAYMLETSHTSTNHMFVQCPQCFYHQNSTIILRCLKEFISKGYWSYWFYDERITYDKFRQKSIQSSLQITLSTLRAISLALILPLLVCIPVPRTGKILFENYN